MIQRKKFNISLLGESQVGKTCMLTCLKNGKFQDEGISTIGLDSYIDEAVLYGKKYKFKIFDTAGQERFRSVSKNTIKFSDGFMIIFSVINRESFLKIEEWIDCIKSEVDISTKSIFLIGNKIDLPNRVILNEEAYEYAKTNKIKYFETSAKTGHGIKEVFEQLYQDIYNLQKELGLNDDNIDLKITKKKSFCC